MKKVVLSVVLFFLMLINIGAQELTLSIPQNFRSYKYNGETLAITEEHKITLDIENKATITLYDDKNIPLNTQVSIIDTEEAEVLFDWDHSSIENLEFRYSIDGKNYHLLEEGAKAITLINIPSNTLTVFTLEAKAEDGEWEYWNKGGVYPVKVRVPIQKDNKWSFRLTAAPYSLGIFDFIHGHEIKDAKYLTVSEYGFAFDAELGYLLGDKVNLYLGAGFGEEFKEETVIPEEFGVIYLKGYTGLDVNVIKGERFSSSLGLFGGVMMAINAKVYSTNSILGARVRCDLKINEHLNLGVQTRFTASYHPAKEPLYTSMTYLLDPMMVGLDIRF